MSLGSCRLFLSFVFFVASVNDDCDDEEEEEDDDDDYILQ